MPLRTTRRLSRQPTRFAACPRLSLVVSADADERRTPRALEFPGCRPVYISRDDIAGCEGRFEFRDADTEVAMVCGPTIYYHERQHTASPS